MEAASRTNVCSTHLIHTIGGDAASYLAIDSHRDTVTEEWQISNFTSTTST
jgi:hypothetical protein